MAEEEVGRLNLKEYEVLIKRKQANDRRVRYNAAIIAAAVYNCAPFGDSNRKPVTPLDFIPELKHLEEESSDLSKMTPEQQAVYFMNMFNKSKLMQR